MSPAKRNAKPIVGPPGFDSAGIIAACETWEDITKIKIQIGNRLGAMERANMTPPKDLLLAYEYLQDAKHSCELLIEKEWRQHPLAAWAREVKGLGEHSAAYLLAQLNGDPLVAYPKFWVENGDAHSSDETHLAVGVPKRELHAGEPYERTISQLWAYCGVGDPDRKRRKGATQEECLGAGKPQLRARLYLISESFLKAKNERYRAVYDAEKARTVDRECPTCKGDGCSDGHRHAMALRRVAKEFLKDLWLEARAMLVSIPSEDSPPVTRYAETRDGPLGAKIA